jgi:hypothetical protein
VRSTILRRSGERPCLLSPGRSGARSSRSASRFCPAKTSACAKGAVSKLAAIAPAFAGDSLADAAPPDRPQRSHVPMHIWLQAIYLMCSSKKGIATRQLHRTFGGSLKTAWFLGHRIREAMTVLKVEDTDPPLGGANQVVEADETYVGGKAANRKGKIPPKAPILSLIERDGQVRSFHVPNVTAQTLKPIIVSHVNKATYLMTDESPVYWSIGREFAGHSALNHSAQEYVRAAFWHTNTVENFFSIFRRGIYGCYFHVSETYLHRYAAEFDFHHNNRIALGIDDQARAERALMGTKGKRLTYRTTGLTRRDAPSPD